MTVSGEAGRGMLAEASHGDAESLCYVGRELGQLRTEAVYGARVAGSLALTIPP